MSTERDNAIKVLLGDYITPLLTNLGFGRQHRTYRRVDARGDAIVVNLQPSSSSSKAQYEFYLNVSLAPRPWVDYMRADESGHESTADRDRPVGEAEAMISWRLDPPAGFRWVVSNAESANSVGAILCTALANLLATVIPLADRAVLLARLRSDDPPRGAYARDAALVALIVADGPSEELDELLDPMDAVSPAFAAWARRRAAARV